jgi:hypothetical protein
MEQNIQPDPTHSLMEKPSDITEEICDFIDDLLFVVWYASTVMAYPLLPKAQRAIAKNILTEARRMLEIYQNSLVIETQGELESREDLIRNEMGTWSSFVVDSEGILDNLLIYQDNKPDFRKQLDEEDLILSDSAGC